MACVQVSLVTYLSYATVDSLLLNYWLIESVIDWIQKMETKTASSGLYAEYPSYQKELWRCRAGLVRDVIQCRCSWVQNDNFQADVDEPRGQVQAPLGIAADHCLLNCTSGQGGELKSLMDAGVWKWPILFSVCFITADCLISRLSPWHWPCQRFSWIQWGLWLSQSTKADVAVTNRLSCESGSPWFASCLR